MTRVAAVLLAAGSSRRFGADDKLLALIEGQPLVVGVARRLREAGLGEVVAVVRDPQGPVARALAGLVTRRVTNLAAVRGMGSSIAAGIAALDTGMSSALIVPGDMPGLTPALVHRLIATFDRHGGTRIVHPVLPDGSQRNPVLWPRRYFAELAALDGETGGKAVLSRYHGEAVGIAADAAEVADIDTVADLEHWRALLGGPSGTARPGHPGRRP